MRLKRLLARLVSLVMVGNGLYQMYLSINSIFFIYPQLTTQAPGAMTLQAGLMEKAILIFISMIANGVYGVALLFKPEEKIQILHIILGVTIFVGSLFFVQESGPVAIWLRNFLTPR